MGVDERTDFMRALQRIVWSEIILFVRSLMD